MDQISDQLANAIAQVSDGLATEVIKVKTKNIVDQTSQTT